MWRRPVIAVKQAFVCNCSMVADNWLSTIIIISVSSMSESYVLLLLEGINNPLSRNSGEVVS